MVNNLRLSTLALALFVFIGESVSQAEELKIVTLNVLATPWKSEQRIPALFAELDSSGADIIALQEVAPWIAEKLQSEPWLNRYHYPADEAGKIQIAHEFLTLTKVKPISRQTLKLPSNQGRIAFLTTIPFQDTTLTLTSIHLDSFLEDGPKRTQQLNTIFKTLEDKEHSILLGDFNFGDDEQPDTSALSDKYKDPWLILHPDDPGFTWNRKLNKRANNDSFIGEPSRRLDRVLFSSESMEAKSISLFADKPVSKKTPKLFPSDHFGLICTLQIKN